MQTRTTVSFWVAVGASFLTVWCLTPAAWAQSARCETTNGGITCPASRYQLLRDKARVGELLCEALETGSLEVALPTRLQAVCESASETSRIWANAQTKIEHAKAAREAQRQANRRAGKIAELRRTVGEQRRRLEARSGQIARWRIIAVSAGGIAALLGGWLVVEKSQVFQ